MFEKITLIRILVFSFLDSSKSEVSLLLLGLKLFWTKSRTKTVTEKTLRVEGIDIFISATMSGVW